MTLDDIKDVLEEVDKVFPPKECIGFDIEKAETSIFDNKLGGTPYFPKDMEYPNIDGENLPLLVQINFNTFKSIENFPNHGILQIFVANDDCYGYDWSKEHNHKFRIIYHENVIEDTTQLIESIDYNMDMFPFEGEYKLTPKEPFIAYATPMVEDFMDAFVEAYNSLREEPIGDIWDLGDDLTEQLYDRNEREYAWIGGYPVFTQSDPRYSAETINHTTTLFELDSFEDIMWGDCGTGEFFIKPDDLINKDFTNVLYNWDCC